MPGRHTRSLIRVLVGIALCTALGACIAVPAPEDLPAAAFRQGGIYRLEVALIVFYSGLLLITPAFAGMIRGRLPIEISARGAKFAEEASHSAAVNEARIEKLERTTNALIEGLTTADIEIQRLKEANDSDKTQQGVGSKL